MTRKNSGQNSLGEKPETIVPPSESRELIERATSSKAKAKRERPRKRKPEKPSPMPDESQPAPASPQVAQQDAAEAFMKATSQSQAFTPATQGLLGSLRLGLPDRDVYFKTKQIEVITQSDGSKGYKNTALVWLYNLPDGARLSQSEPRLWMVDEKLVPTFREKKAKVSTPV
jgi:hypothetical protein